MKKLCSFLLAMVCLMVLVPVIPASAAATAVYTDDFSGTFGSNSFTETSEIFSGGQGNGTYSASTDGYNGTTSLKAAANGANVNSFIGTKSFSTFDSTTNNTLVFNIRMNIPDKATEGTKYIQTDAEVGGYNLWSLFGGSDGKYYVRDSAAGKDWGVLSHGTWYNISMKLSKSNTLCYTYIYDASTGEQVAYHYAHMTSSTGLETIFAKRLLFRLYNLTENGILFDDAKLYSVSADNALLTTEGTTAENSIVEKNGTITVKFDQPVTPEKANFVVKDSSGNAVTGAVESIKVKDFNTVTVKLAGNLSDGAAYTLDFSGVKSAAGTGASNATLAFNTPVKEIYTEDFASGFSNSEIFGFDNDGTYSVSTDGYNGGTSALKILSDGDCYLATKNFSTSFGLTSENAVVLNISMKLAGEPTDGVQYMICGSDSGSYRNWTVFGENDGKYHIRQWSDTGATQGTLSPDTWYNASFKMSGNLCHTVMYDAQTGEKVLDYNTQVNSTVDASIKSRLIFKFQTATPDGVFFDDAKLYSVQTGSTFASVTEGSTAEDSVIDIDGTLTVKFDRPVTPATTDFVVKNSEGNQVSNAVKSIRVKDFNTVTVKLGGLSPASNYTLDYSAVKSSGNATITGETDLAFSTKASATYIQNYDGTFDSNYFKSSSKIWNDGQWNGTYEAVEDATYGKGVKMFTSPEITKNPRYAHVKTHTLSKFGLSDRANLVFTTRFKVEGESASDVSWSINPNSGPYALGSIYGGVDGKYTIDGDEHRPLTAGKWYNMTVLLKTTGRNEMIIADSQTGEVITYKTAAVPAEMANQMLLIQTDSLSEGSTLTVCDTTMYCTENTDTFNFVAEGSSAENTEIAIDEGITLKFDKPILGRELNAELAAVLMGSVNNGASIREVRIVDFDTAVVTFAGLNNMSDYVLDFSNMKSAGGNALSEESVKTLAFNTGMDEDNDITVVGGVNCSGTSVGDTVKFTLCTPSADITNVSFVVAFFDSENSKMIGAELVSNQNISATPNEYTVPVENDYTGADSVKVIILESFSTLRPLIRDINSAIE